MMLSGDRKGGRANAQTARNIYYERVHQQIGVNVGGKLQRAVDADRTNDVGGRIERHDQLARYKDVGTINGHLSVLPSARIRPVAALDCPGGDAGVAHESES